MLKITALICLLLTTQAGFRLVNHDHDDGHEHFSPISDPKISYFEVFYSSLLGDLGILPSDSLKCFDATSGPLILNYLTTLQNFAAAFSYRNWGNIESGLLSSESLIPQLQVTIRCFLPTNDFASIASKLGWSGQQAQIPSYLASYFYSDPSDVYNKLSIVVSSINANNYPVAGVNAGNGLKAIANTMNSMGVYYYTVIAIHNGIIEYLSWESSSYCLTGVAGQNIVNFFVGWGYIAATSSSSTFATESEYYLFYGNGNQYLRQLNQTDTCIKNAYYRVSMIFTEQFTDYAITYIKFNSGAQAQIAQLVNITANPYLLAWTVIAPLIEEIIEYGQLVNEYGYNPNYPVTIAWNGFTQFLNTAWGSFGLTQSQLQNCFQGCSENQYQLTAAIGNWYELLVQGSQYNFGGVAYYSSLNNAGSCQYSLECALATNDWKNLLNSVGITNQTALNLFVNSQPQPFLQNVSNIYYQMYNPTNAGFMFAQMMTNLSNTMKMNQQTLFIYEFYSNIAVNLETVVPTSFWSCYNDLQASNDYKMWYGFAQAFANGNSNRFQAISNLVNFWNSNGGSLWTELSTIWEYCQSLEWYFNGYVANRLYWNIWQGNFTTFVNQTLYETPENQFWESANSFKNGMLNNNAWLAAQGITDFIVQI